MTTHLLIDLDGTLLGSKKFKLHSSFIRHSARFLKTHYRMSFWKSLQLLGDLRFALEGNGENKNRNELRAAHVFARALKLPEHEALQVMNQMAMFSFSHLESCFFPIPGAKTFIDWARSHFTLVLATNPVWPKEIVLIRLGWSDVTEDCFDKITSAETMHACKPHIQYYTELLEQLKLRPETCMMIGDSRKKDLPAEKVGIPTYLLESQNDFKKLRELLEKKL